jgi:hypothetical protein
MMIVGSSASKLAKRQTCPRSFARRRREYLALSYVVNWRSSSTSSFQIFPLRKRSKRLVGLLIKGNVFSCCAIGLLLKVELSPDSPALLDDRNETSTDTVIRDDSLRPDVTRTILDLDLALEPGEEVF